MRLLFFQVAAIPRFARGRLVKPVPPGYGDTALGSSAAPADPDGTCATLDLTFSHAGGYPIEIAVAPDTLPGDFSLRFY